MKIYASGMTFGEGLRWHDGALWMSDPQSSTLWTDASGTWMRTNLPSTANGLWFLPNGSLVAAMRHERRIGIWRGDRFEPYADLGDLAEGPLGDVAGDEHGNLYIDDVAYNFGEEPRPGRILLVSPDRSVSVAAHDVAFPNGLAFVDGGRTLVVAETFAKRLVAFSVGDDGSLSDKRPYADLAELVGEDVLPDGMWPDPGGGVWVATLTGNVVVLLRGDKVIATLDTDHKLPISCCLDDDGARLFVTVADTSGQTLHGAIEQKKLTTEVAVFDLRVVV